MWVQVAPPSSDRYSPPSVASMLVHTRFGSAGETATVILPRTPAGSPGLRVSSVHVSPPSVDLYSPDPAPPLQSCHGRRYTSQSVAYSTPGLEGSMTRSAAPARGLLNSTRAHVRPPSRDRNTPRSSFGANGWPSAAT